MHSVVISIMILVNKFREMKFGNAELGNVEEEELENEEQREQKFRNLDEVLDEDNYDDPERQPDLTHERSNANNTANITKFQNKDYCTKEC